MPLADHEKRLPGSMVAKETGYGSSDLGDTKAALTPFFGVTPTLGQGAFVPTRIATPLGTIVFPGGGGDVTPSLAQGDVQLVTVTDGTAFNLTNPAGEAILGSVWTQSLLIEIHNTSGGAMGAITWGGSYILTGAFTNPATGKRRWILFQYLPSGFVELNRAAADYS